MSATAAGADNAMRAQVFSLPELLAGQYQALEAATRAVLPTPAIFALREVILTGCGDSQIAGQLVREAWTRLTGIPCRALTAMQAARFETELPRARYPHTPLVVAVSSSGDVARTVEAAQQWRQRGALTVALTANPESRLARAAERCLQITLPPFAAAPGVRSFFLSAAALYLLAVRIGEVRGRFPQAKADHLRTRIPHAADLLARMLPAVEPQLAALARQWRDHRRYELLAGGPARGAAAYGRAKLLEATGVPAIDVDVEEWMHLDYFARDPEACATLVLCPPPARDGGRVRELEPLLQRLGRPYRILTGPALADQFRAAIVLPAALHAAVAASGLRSGVLVATIPHTTAGLTVLSFPDPLGLQDVADELKRLVPTRIDFKHQHDTPQDAAGHIKSALVGISLSLIVDGGALQLGHSQAVYFMEFDGPRDRQLYLQPMPAAAPRKEANS